MDETYKVVADLIKKHSSFLVTSHIDPDGDAVGCQLAIASFLKRLDKTVKVLSEDRPAATYHFLKGIEDVVTSPGDGGACEVAIVVDAASLDRIGWVADFARRCDIIVNIDHHRSNINFGHYNIVDTSAGATGQIVYNLLRAVGPDVTRDEAEALYVAILSDTGCFRFPTTSGAALRIAASLLDNGVKPYHVASEIFWKKPLSSVRLLGEALASIEVTPDGRIAMMAITRNMYARTGASRTDAEGFANYPRSIEGVVVGVLLREVDEGQFRVSLRSIEGFDVDALARSFGGGGHATAAGFRISGDLESVKREVRSRISAVLPDLKPTTSS